MQPLQEATDPETGRRYLLCEFNRDASSYRSPWSNKYDPPLEDGYTPGDRVRQLEASRRFRCCVQSAVIDILRIYFFGIFASEKTVLCVG